MAFAAWSSVDTKKQRTAADGKAPLNSLDYCFDKWGSDFFFFFCSCKNTSEAVIDHLMTEGEINDMSVKVTGDDEVQTFLHSG